MKLLASNSLGLAISWLPHHVCWPSCCAALMGQCLVLNPRMESECDRLRDCGDSGTCPHWAVLGCAATSPDRGAGREARVVGISLGPSRAASSPGTHLWACLPPSACPCCPPRFLASFLSQQPRWCLVMLGRAESCQPPVNSWRKMHKMLRKPRRPAGRGTRGSEVRQGDA